MGPHLDVKCCPRPTMSSLPVRDASKRRCRPPDMYRCSRTLYGALVLEPSARSDPFGPSERDLCCNGLGAPGGRGLRVGGVSCAHGDARERHGCLDPWVLAWMTCPRHGVPPCTGGKWKLLSRRPWPRTRGAGELWTGPEAGGGMPGTTMRSAMAMPDAHVVRRLLCVHRSCSRSCRYSGVKGTSPGDGRRTGGASHWFRSAVTAAVAESRPGGRDG
mmetsp:Transcript_32686/g.58623  ORF Transcript_32686/g.58623 Transcript_32686/m.58623 type:complete len:217 (-) Transcript_32686:304-954(-)